MTVLDNIDAALASDVVFFGVLIVVFLATLALALWIEGRAYRRDSRRLARHVRLLQQMARDDQRGRS